MFKRIAIYLDLLIFPRRCLGCRIPDQTLCLACISIIERSKPNALVSACFSYQDPVIRKAILRLKFYNDRTLFGALSIPMSELILDIMSERLNYESLEDFVLVPIPLSKKRARSRGYNQSKILVDKIAAELGIHANTSDLVKVKDTKAQAQIPNKAERLQNVIGVFKVIDKNIFEDKVVILVDDVSTTGATLREAKKVLLDAKAKEVLCTTLAFQPLI